MLLLGPPKRKALGVGSNSPEPRRQLERRRGHRQGLTPNAARAVDALFAVTPAPARTSLVPARPLTDSGPKGKYRGPF
jgi:hypothetical protein